MLVDITVKLVADAVNSGIESGTPLTVADVGRIVGRKARQIRSMPGMAELDTFDLATAVAAHPALKLSDANQLALIKFALKEMVG